MQIALDQLLLPTLMPDNTWEDILLRIDSESVNHAKQTTKVQQKALGQVFTPLNMSRQLISLIKEFSCDDITFADPGTGTGMLSAALLSRHANETLTPPNSLTAYECDLSLHSKWHQNFSEICTEIGMPKSKCVLSTDFYGDAKSILTTGKPQGGEKVSMLITNPPYKKLASTSELSLLLKEYGIHAPNHYAAFIALSVLWLEEEGDLLAILPRSFFNGSYFKKFRQWLGERVSIEHIVAYGSRSNFGHKNVLQENICLYLKKSSQRDTIRVSFCDSADSTATHDLLVSKERILGDIWKLPSTPEQLSALYENDNLPETLESLMLTVKTGAVEVHRPECKQSRQVRVLYSRDFNDKGCITWNEVKKPRTFSLNRAVHPLPSDNSGFVVIKRITANDGNKHRIMPTWVSRSSTGLSEISFDNHVQVFSVDGMPIAEKAGAALMRYLQSENANLCMSTISGTTQINTFDLKELRYPQIWQD